MPARAVPAADRASSFLTCLSELLDELSCPSPLLHGFLGPVAIAVVAIGGPLRSSWAQPAVQPAPGSSANGGTLARRAGPGPGTAARGGPHIGQPRFSSLVHGVDPRFCRTPPFIGPKQKMGPRIRGPAT